MANKDDKCENVNTIVQNLINCVGEKSENTTPLSPSIYIAPAALRNLSPTSFKPRVVSIGPLHRKNVNQQRFEGRKAALVQRLFGRLAPRMKTQMLTACVEEVFTSIKKIKACYADIKGYDDLQLAEMMVMDASFILEFIHKISEKESSGSKLTLLDNYICYDLVLLENQIPFFVLNDIFQYTILQFDKDQVLTEFINPLLKYPNPFQERIKLSSNKSYTEYDHILGYLHACYNPEIRIPSYFPSPTIHSAVELDRAGVKFKPNHKAKWPLAMDVKMYRCSCIFWCLSKPTLKMPTLRINHFTELVLRNLIAYEQLCAVHPYITSYARAMDMLIDTHEDIAKLVTSKVIINHLGSNEEAANMINGLCKEVVRENFFYGEQWEKLDNHFNGYWPLKIVKLRRTYFSSPWNIIALLAGMVLFALAVVQTVFAIKSAGK